MAQPLPIEITNLSKRGLLDETRFFRLLSEHNNYVDPASARNFYNALVALIKDELRENGGLRLPDIGDMVLVTQKAHIGWVGKTRGIVPESKTLKFYPKEALRKEFKPKGAPSVVKTLPNGLPTEYRVEE